MVLEIPSTPLIFSSILTQIPSSTSSGLAPGKGTVTFTMSRANWGNISRRIWVTVITPAVMTRIIYQVDRDVIVDGPICKGFHLFADPDGCIFTVMPSVAPGRGVTMTRSPSDSPASI